MSPRAGPDSLIRRSECDKMKNDERKVLVRVITILSSALATAVSVIVARGG